MKTFAENCLKDIIYLFQEKRTISPTYFLNIIPFDATFFALICFIGNLLPESN